MPVVEADREGGPQSQRRGLDGSGLSPTTRRAASGPPLGRRTRFSSDRRYRPRYALTRIRSRRDSPARFPPGSDPPGRRGAPIHPCRRPSPPASLDLPSSPPPGLFGGVAIILSERE